MSDELGVKERWYSGRLQTEITVVRWGVVGRPVLVFPSAGGDAEEIERHGLVNACGPLLAQSGSFVFTDIGRDHGGGPPFEPVVRFVNRYRAAPRRVADRMFVSCGVYEPLIVPNRSMVPVFEAAGMTVRYVEARDGHSWENWRDRLRDGLSWIFPGPQKFFYE